MPNPTATNPTIDAYVEAVQRGLKSYHVVFAKNGWIIRQADKSGAPSKFPTKEEAVKRAQELARSYKTDVFIHRKDGLIQDRSSYAPESS